MGVPSFPAVYSPAMPIRVGVFWLGLIPYRLAYQPSTRRFIGWSFFYGRRLDDETTDKLVAKLRPHQLAHCMTLSILARNPSPPPPPRR